MTRSEEDPIILAIAGKIKLPPRAGLTETDFEAFLAARRAEGHRIDPNYCEVVRLRERRSIPMAERPDRGKVTTINEEEDHVIRSYGQAPTSKTGSLFSTNIAGWERLIACCGNSARTRSRRAGIGTPTTATASTPRRARGVEKAHGRSSKRAQSRPGNH